MFSLARNNVNHRWPERETLQKERDHKEGCEAKSKNLPSQKLQFFYTGVAVTLTPAHQAASAGIMIITVSVSSLRVASAMVQLWAGWRPTLVGQSIAFGTWSLEAWCVHRYWGSFLFAWNCIIALFSLSPYDKWISWFTCIQRSEKARPAVDSCIWIITVPFSSAVSAIV